MLEEDMKSYLKFDDLTLMYSSEQLSTHTSHVVILTDSVYFTCIALRCTHVGMAS